MSNRKEPPLSGGSSVFTSRGREHLFPGVLAHEAVGGQAVAGLVALDGGDGAGTELAVGGEPLALGVELRCTSRTQPPALPLRSTMPG